MAGCNNKGPRVAWLALVLLFTCLPVFAHSKQRIVVLYRDDIPPYIRIVNVLKHRYADLVLDLDIIKDGNQSPGLAIRLQAFKPSVVVAIGSGALEVAGAMKLQIPVVFCMVPHPMRILKSVDKGRFLGLGMYVDPKAQAEAFVQAFGWAKQVGLICASDMSYHIATQLQHELSLFGVTLNLKRVSDAREALRVLEKMKTYVNAYWLLPDREVLTAPFMQRLMEVSFYYSQPVMTFSKRSVANGADMALVFDEQDISAELVRILDSIGLLRKLKGLKMLPLGRWRLILNRTVLRKMGIEPPLKVMLKASELY